MLGMFLVRQPLCIETAVPSESSQKFLDSQKIGIREKTCKNKILLYERLRMPLEACLQQTIVRNKSKGTIPPRMQFAS